jgi:hypothetical protein
MDQVMGNGNCSGFFSQVGFPVVGAAGSSDKRIFVRISQGLDRFRKNYSGTLKTFSKDIGYQDWVSLKKKVD